MEEKKVLATVNGKEIVEKDLIDVLSGMDQQRAMQYFTEDGKEKLLGEIIAQELFYQEALEHNYEEDEEFKAELERAKNVMLKQYALRKTLANVTVSEADIVGYYFKNEEEFIEPESVKASHILVDSEEKANEIIAEINEGLAFEEAAKKYSSCPSKEQGGDLGSFSKGKMVPEFEEAAFALEVDQVSAPVKTQFGYHVIKVTEKKGPEKMELEAIKDQLQQHIFNLKQAELYAETLGELKKKYNVEVHKENF